MMMRSNILKSHGKELIGAGIYTVAEAALLADVPAASIRRWSSGYTYKKSGIAHAAPPKWVRAFAEIDGQTVLSFLDLMEARFIRAFRRHNVSWAAIRAAAQEASELFGDTHPFTRRRFQTDGKRIFARIEASGDMRLFDLNRRSWVFSTIVDPSLYRGVEFERDQAARWYPMYPKKTVVLDPSRGFGRPITNEGVATDILDAALGAAHGNVDEVARWYGVSAASVRAAAWFEARMRPVGPTAAAA